MKSIVLAGSLLAGVGCATALQHPALAQPPATAPQPTPAMQYLYGSAEGGIVDSQVFRSLRAHALEAARRRPADSAVLAETGSAGAPEWVPCHDKPFAVIFDSDETLTLNMGAMRYFAENAIPFDGEVWTRWVQTGAPQAIAVPGAVETVEALRAAGITVVVNTNRDNAVAEGTAAALEAAGLGTFVHGETLFMRGDVDGETAKDGRRSAIAEDYCVIAMAGDQLGDFTASLDDPALTIPQRRELATRGPISGMWGNGWFLLPNPVYGAAMQGDFDDVFPAHTRWTDPEADDVNQANEE